MTAAPAEKGVSYFSLLGLKPAFSLDMEALETSFYRLQQHHPDRLSADNSLRTESLAADINHAYRTLRSAAGRARCLLELMGRQVSPDDPARLSRDLLMQQFELRDELERAESTEELEALRQRAETMLREVGAAFERAWQQQRVDEAETSYQQLLFIERFASAVDEREDLLLEENQI